MRSYDTLIHEMSELIDVPLSLNERGAVVIEVDSMLTIHLEHLVPSEHIRIASLLYTLPPDALRERVLQSALRANNLPTVSHGALAFSSRRSALVLFKHIPISSLNGEGLCDRLELFILKGKEWISALDSGRTEPIGFFQSIGKGPGGFFGLS